MANTPATNCPALKKAIADKKTEIAKLKPLVSFYNKKADEAIAKAKAQQDILDKCVDDLDAMQKKYAAECGGSKSCKVVQRRAKA